MAVKVCPNLKGETSRILGSLEAGKQRHPRGSLGKLIRKGDGPQEIEGLAKTFAKYTNGTDDN
jgi:hypothetical protein